MRFTQPLLTAFLCFLTFLAYSQSNRITGKVVNEEKEALSDVIVKLKYIGVEKIIAYTYTSETGSFELTINRNTQPDSLELSFSSIGYATLSCGLPDNGQPLFIELKNSTVELREVTVTADKIRQRGDTITYLVSSFASPEDRTIGDVLKKMPGIEVRETGQIMYQGQPLNKFYIEGSDMLGGRYGLATNNISYQDVSIVEVLENHQPIKALEDVVFSDSPAMNIKLKADAKTRWAGTIKGGGGIPELWIAEAFAMRFKLKTQTLNTYKGNNAGNQSNELNVFSSISDFETSLSTVQLPTYIQVGVSTAGSIGSSRSTFNQTNNLTSNNLVKVGKDFDLITEFTGSFDRRESEQESKTTYFLGGEQISVEDKTENASTFKQAFTGRIHLKSNQPTYYLNNNLNFNYDRNDPSVVVLGSYSNRQKADIENLQISNDFDILRRVGDKFYSFRSTNEYASKPQTLEVTKNGLPSMRSSIGLSSFSSNNSTNFSFMVGKIRVSAPIRLLYQYRQIENALNDTINSLNTNKLRLNITPSANYNFHDFRFSLSAPLYYQALYIENRTHHLYGVNPRFSLEWTPSSLFSMRTAISHSNNLPDENLYYHGLILRSYRNLSNGYIDFYTGETVSFSAGMAYKDVIRALFADVGVGLSKMRSAKISGQDFIDDYIIDYDYPGSRHTEALSVSGSLSKGVEMIDGIVAIYPSFTRSKMSIARNGIDIPFTFESYMIRGKVNSMIGGKVNLTYDVSYSFSTNKMDASNRQYASFTNLSESLKAAWSPIKTVQLSYLLDHHCNELSSNNYKHFVFSDISLSVLPGNRWEFALNIKNIFDERYYSYFTESELATFYRSYTIRPRNILASATLRF